MEITYGKLEEIAKKLRDYPAIEKEKKTPSKFEAINVLQAEIEALRQRGYTMDQIAVCLRDEGFDISVATLRNYMQRIKQESSKSKKKTTKKSAPKKDSTVSVEKTKTETVKNQASQKTDNSTFKPKEDSEKI